MIKIIKDVTKPPRTLKEFWEIFVGYDDRIKKEFVDIKKYRIWKMAFQITLIVVAVISIVVSCLIATGYFETPEKSNIVATEEIKWMNEYQLYMLHLENRGEIENNILIEIKFPFNCSINNSSLYKGKYQLIHEEITWIDTFYTALYSNIRENQSYSVRLAVYSDDLINNSSVKISPSYVRAWTNKGEVKINRDNG